MLVIIIAAAVVLLDQTTKYLSSLYLSPLGTSYPLIPGVFHLTSAHNTGAAWGLFKGGRWIFIAMTVAVCFVLTWYLIKNRRLLKAFPKVTLALILGGAVGNLADRICLGYVRDMFDFCLIRFPIFNVADAALSVGCALLVINVLFMPEASVFPALDNDKGAKEPAKPDEDAEAPVHPGKAPDHDGTAEPKKEDADAFAESGQDA